VAFSAFVVDARSIRGSVVSSSRAIRFDSIRFDSIRFIHSIDE